MFRTTHLLAILVSLSFTARLIATDVAFWTEYHPARHELEQTCLLLQFNEWPFQALGPIKRVESVGPAVLGGDGRFGKALRGRAFAGRVGITATNLFRSEEGSLEFWLRPLGVNNLSDKTGGGYRGFRSTGRDAG